MSDEYRSIIRQTAELVDLMAQMVSEQQERLNTSYVLLLDYCDKVNAIADRADKVVSEIGANHV